MHEAFGSFGFSLGVKKRYVFDFFNPKNPEPFPIE